MVTPAKVRMNKMRQKREGRSLTVWLYQDAASAFKKIKKLTGQTNDQIANLAIVEIYDSVFLSHINKHAGLIRKKIENGGSRNELTPMYRDLIKILQLDYHSASDIKEVVNSLELPNYSGKIGSWKINQIRELMK